jgi:hypothetical protein
MDTDRPTDEMLQRMLAAVVDALGTEQHVDRLIEAARAEAEGEVKDLLKAAMKATLLQRAVSRLERPAPRAVVAESTPTQSEGPTGCYIYGIVRGGDDGPPAGVAGVDPRSPLRFVVEGDVRALTSTISLSDFGSEAMAERVKDLDWVEEKVCAHDAVLKEMLATGPVVPCRFCTVLRGEEDVRAVLARHADELAETLGHLDGKKEWGVKVLAPEKSGSNGEPGPGPASGKAYFLQKKRDEQARGESARAVRDAADACHHELSELAAGATRLAIGRARGDTDVVMNGAYLVAYAAADRFQTLVGLLAERYGGLGVRLEMTGPWPPYNFVSLDLSLEPPPAADEQLKPEAAA